MTKSKPDTVEKLVEQARAEVHAEYQAKEEERRCQLQEDIVYSGGRIANSFATLRATAAVTQPDKLVHDREQKELRRLAAAAKKGGHKGPEYEWRTVVKLVELTLKGARHLDGAERERVISKLVPNGLETLVLPQDPRQRQRQVRIPRSYRGIIAFWNNRVPPEVKTVSAEKWQQLKSRINNE